MTPYGIINSTGGLWWFGGDVFALVVLTGGLRIIGGLDIVPP